MLLLFAIACAPNVATLGICSPVGSFLLPQPDHVVMDAEHNIEVAVACAESEVVAANWARADGLAEGELILTCASTDELLHCTGELPTDTLFACSGEAAWSILHLVTSDDADSGTSGGDELDEVGIPFAVTTD